MKKAVQKWAVFFIVDAIDEKQYDGLLLNSASAHRKGEVMPNIEDAIILATMLHKGQVDKQGMPYILHPLWVMLQLDTETERIVGVLHDTKEDCGVTDAQLRRLGYSEEVIEALDYLSKRPEEEADYDAFIERIKRGPALSRRVKLKDLAHNSDPSRTSNPTDADLRRRERYLRAIVRLQE